MTNNYWQPLAGPRPFDKVRVGLEPLSFQDSEDGSVSVEVRQEVYNLQGNSISDDSHDLENKQVKHVFRLQNGTSPNHAF